MNLFTCLPDRLNDAHEYQVCHMGRTCQEGGVFVGEAIERESAGIAAPSFAWPLTVSKAHTLLIRVRAHEP